MKNATKTEYVIKESSAKMPASCFGRYCHIAVIEMEVGAPHPRAIDTRIKGVVRVVDIWERIHSASSGGPKTNYGRAWVQAEALVRALELNQAKTVKHMERLAIRRAAYAAKKTGAA